MSDYTKADIARIIKRPLRTITHWTSLRLVTPDSKLVLGRGYTRTYSNRNLIEIAMIDYMSADMGLALHTIMGALEAFKGQHRDTVLDPRFGRRFDFLYCAETTGADAEWRYRTFFVGGGSMVVDEKSGEASENEDHEVVFGADGDVLKKISDWVRANKISGFAMLRMGDIRNKAIEKHDIRLMVKP